MNNLPASNQSEPKNEIVVYQPDETVRLDVRLEENTVWLTQNQMTDLFQRDRSVITRHINNVFAEGELDEQSNVHFLHIAISDKPVKMYSLNVIISVGYRVKSFRGTQFRIWATNVLREYLLRGYSVNARLNQLEDRMDRRLAKTEAEVIELKEKVDFFVQTKEPPLQGVFYDGQLWDARALRALRALGAGRLLASDSLPCWRKSRRKILVRHRFRGLLPFCLCRRASRQKGRRDEIGSPSWFAPSLIMLRNRPAPHALR